MAEKKLKSVAIEKKDKYGNKKVTNYVMVNERVRAFREDERFRGWSIETRVHELSPDACTMCASITMPDGIVRATGWAREVRTDSHSMVNSTSYVENCETSAVGRALGFLGIGIEDAICSAEELAMAIQAKQNKPQRVTKKVPLTEREQEELDDICAQADFAESAETLYQLYYRVEASNLAPYVKEHCAMVKSQKGWK